MAKPVDQAAELLYGLPLDEFTTARNAAAKALRDRDLKAEADEVKAFVKPTVPAWAVNQLTRRRQDALDGLVDAARDELGGKASEAVLGKVRQTLEAATVDDQAAEDIRLGRLAKELEPAGFGTLAAHAKPPSKKKAQARPDAAAARKAQADARAKLREAEDELRAAQAEERQAHKRWQQAQGDAEEAAERVEKVRGELETLRSGT